MTIRNKKGIALTEPMTLLLLLVMFSMLTLGWVTFGTQLYTSGNANLNDESVSYIATANGFKINNQEITGKILTQSDLEDPFYVQDTNGTSTKDDALEFLYYREQSKSWRGMANSLYSAPSYVRSSLGLGLSDWNFVIQALNIIVWGIIFFVIYKIIRGLIK